jgi:hypothetical protein
VAVADPGLDFIVFTGLTLPDARPPEPLAALLEQRTDWLGQRIATAPIPVITVGHTCVNLSDYGRELLDRGGIQQLPGIDLAMTAIGHALRWAQNRGRPGALAMTGAAASVSPSVSVSASADTAGRAWSEAAARELLAASGVPVVPGELVNSADAAVAAARRLGLPVVLKICSAQISHKSDIGGVVVGPRTEAEIRDAYARVREAGQAVLGARIDGVLISPMRAGGVELVAGVTVDPAFGPVLAVGLGGVWVEVLNDVSLRVLPVGPDEVRRMLAELRGRPLLNGSRGSRPADLDRLAEVIWRLGEAALKLNDGGAAPSGARDGGTLRALEVNPLWVDGDQVEALDVLVVTGGAP